VKYSPYPEYKESGVAWLDRFPRHWNRSSLKHLVSTPITDGPHETPTFEDEGVPFVSAESVWGGEVHLESRRGNISRELHEIYSRKYCPRQHDIYVVKSGSTTGKVAYVDFDVEFNIWSPLAAIRCDRSVAYPRFVYYALSSEYFQRLVQVSWSFGTQPNIGMSVLENLEIALGDPEEQTAIANFLDRETGRIDALILKQRELIELLGEKRRALISRCVTRGLPPAAAKAAGLDPHPQLKPTGIDWLGDVPKHWDVRRIKAITEILRGKFTHRPRNDPRMYDGSYPFVQTGDVAQSGKYVSDYSQTLNEEGYRVSKEFPHGTLVMTIAANIGDVAILSFDACFPDSIVGFVPRYENTVEFLFYLFSGMKSTLLSTSTLNTQLNLNVDRIGVLNAPVPPQEEQTAIANFLDAETAKLDRLVSKAEEMIDRLQEYRTALITAAVTGKIDVREEASK